jgi:hypothetical protein
MRKLSKLINPPGNLIVMRAPFSLMTGTPVNYFQRVAIIMNRIKSEIEGPCSYMLMKSEANFCFFLIVMLY